MILQSLVKYYDSLLQQSEVSKPGWCKNYVSYAISLSCDGKVLNIISIKVEKKFGNNVFQNAQNLEVPETVLRSGNVSVPNFLADNSSYLLGVDAKGKPENGIRNFQASKELHLKILQGIDSVLAKAIIAFFETWDIENIDKLQITEEVKEDIFKNNLIFRLNDDYAQDDKKIQNAWNHYLSNDSENEEGICLVSGKKGEIERIHKSIRGVSGAQSSGASLVSFNENAFESYGKVQSYNAPVSKYSVFAYTTALNYMLACKQYLQIGNTTIFYWSENAKQMYTNIFSSYIEADQDNQSLIKNVFDNLASDEEISIKAAEESISENQPFYILAISPNSARLSIRFFYQCTFGEILRNVSDHYERMRIVRPSFDKLEYIGIRAMLQETVNKKSRDKVVMPSMGSTVLQAIISGDKYPTTLFQNVLMRIRSDQDNNEKGITKINRERTAIIKAYLLRNTTINKEDLTVGLYEESTNIAYTLGREFSLLEEIQAKANGELNATIKDRYFNSACATPASIFPILLKLTNNHLRKLDNQKFMRIYYEKALCELQSKFSIDETSLSGYPKTLTLDEQGLFILGYYHQTQKRYQKKAEGAEQ